MAARLNAAGVSTRASILRDAGSLGNYLSHHQDALLAPTRAYRGKQSELSRVAMIP